MKREEPNPPTPFPKKEGGEKPEPLVSNIVRGQRVEEAKVLRAKELRREMTPEERIVWVNVRGNRLGYHFRRQQLIHGFIADFYCHAAGLVVEVDGPIHEEQAEYDAARTEAFKQIGIDVIRFRNDEVNGDLASVLARIVAECQRRVASLEEPNPPSPFPKKEGGGAESYESHSEMSGSTAHPHTNQPNTSDPAPPPSFLGKGDGGLGSSRGGKR
jgi:very-short-patch-repair endonuclease